MKRTVAVDQHGPFIISNGSYVRPYPRAGQRQWDTLHGVTGVTRWSPGDRVKVKHVFSTHVVVGGERWVVHGHTPVGDPVGGYQRSEDAWQG